MERGWGHTRFQGCPQAGRGYPGQRLLLHEAGTERPTPQNKDGYGVVGLRGVWPTRQGVTSLSLWAVSFQIPHLASSGHCWGRAARLQEEFSPWAPFPQLWSHQAQQMGLCLWIYRTCLGKTVSLTPFFGQQRFLKPSSPGDQTGSGQKP